MNREAESHLDKAEGYLGKGETWYRKAGTEIALARTAGATWTEIGDRLDRSVSWCQKVVAWAESPANGTSSSPSPYSGEAPAINVRKTRQMLREAPLEQVEQIISSLPADRQQAIAAAAGDRYASARQRFDEEQRRPLTPAERREREQGEQAVREHVARVAAPIQAMSIESLLEEATDMLKSMVEDRGVSAPVLVPIEKALDAFVTEFQVARGMAGLDLYERSDA